MKRRRSRLLEREFEVSDEINGVVDQRTSASMLNAEQATGGILASSLL